MFYLNLETYKHKFMFISIAISLSIDFSKKIRSLLGKFSFISNKKLGYVSDCSTTKN